MGGETAREGWSSSWSENWFSETSKILLNPTPTIVCTQTADLYIKSESEKGVVFQGQSVDIYELG